MIHIQVRRAGLLCLAATVNGSGEATTTWGLTQESASRRLIRLIDKRYPPDKEESDD